MGCADGRFFVEEEKRISDSLGEALLFATICIIGLPVDVHVKDGSIYSGIFYTACVDDDYAIVLKNARMIKKGNRGVNITNGRLIETLVILSEDLVQVVAKGVLVSAEGNNRKVGADDVGVKAGHFSMDANGSSSILPSKEEKGIRPVDLLGDAFLDESAIVNSLKFENRKLDGPVLDKKEEPPVPVSAYGSFPSITVDRNSGENSQGKPSDNENSPEMQRGQTTNEIKGSRTSFDGCEMISSVDISVEPKMVELPKHVSSGNFVVRSENQSHGRHTSEECLPAQCPTILSSRDSTAAPELGQRSPSHSTKVVPNHGRTNKESKLNPRAKIFSPSSAHQRLATPPAVPSLASVTYMPEPSPVVPNATAEPGADITSFVHRSSVPTKVLPHNNMVYGNGRSDLHYAHSVVGHLGSRTQPVRYAGQYNLLQPGAPYVPPNSQNVLPGRVGPFVYVHPISNDIVTQGAAAFSQVPASPVLTPHPINFPKQGNATILYAAPPIVSNGHQPYAIPGYIPISPPLFPVMGPIPVPGSDASLSTKFV